MHAMTVPCAGNSKEHKLFIRLERPYFSSQVGDTRSDQVVEVPSNVADE
jgi:hypothetical protein